MKTCAQAAGGRHGQRAWSWENTCSATTETSFRALECEFCPSHFFGPCRLANPTDSLGPGRLELGAGGGLVGLGVALECGVQSRLLVTDQQEMLELMQHNIRLNDIEDRAKALILNW